MANDTPWRHTAGAQRPRRSTIIANWVLFVLLALIFWPVTLIAGAASLAYHRSRRNKALVAALAGGGMFGLIVIGAVVMKNMADDWRKAPPASYRIQVVGGIGGRPDSTKQKRGDYGR